MKFENPEIREGHNVSKEGPLKEFFNLLTGMLLIALLVIAVLHFTVGYFARFIPFEFEQQMVQGFDDLKVKPSNKQLYLQTLANELASYMELPKDMNVVVHYDESETVNAIATLGGNIFIFQGLIDKMPNENALAMVVAHEIAHIKHRHPIVATGKGLTLAVLVAAISGASGSQAGQVLLGQSINLSLLNFSRSQESLADLEALKAINQYYGHVSGAKDLFDVFSELTNDVQKSIPEFFLSHPLSANRRQVLEDYAREHNFVLNGPIKSLDMSEKSN